MKEILEAGIHWQIINFILFVGGLLYLLRKPLSLFWKERHESIARSLSDAKQLRQNAAQRLLEIEKRYQQIGQESDRLVQSIRLEAEEEKKQIIQEAEEYAVKLKRDAERTLEQEVKKMKNQIRIQMVQVALDWVDRLIRDKIVARDHQKLKDDFLKKFEERL